MLFRELAFATALLAVSTSPQQARAQGNLVSHLPAVDLGRFIAAELDLATVQSSLNPRRGAHQVRFADLGLTVIEASEERVVLEGPYEVMVLRVLERGDSNRDGVEDIVICLSEDAKEGTLASSTVYVLQKYSATTPLVALAWRPPSRARALCGGAD